MLRFIALLSVSLWGISQAKGVLVPLILASMLAFVLAPGVRALRRRGVPEITALIAAAFLFVLPVAAIVYEAVIQGESLARGYPGIVAHLSADLEGVFNSPWGTRLELRDRLDPSQLADWFGREFGAGLGVALKGLRAFLRAGGELFLVLLFALLMLAARARLRSSAELILRGSTALPGGPSAIASNPGHFVDSIAELIQRFLQVRLGIAAVVGTVDFLVLLAFGLPYALIAGAFLGLATLIPIVGFFLGVIPPIVVAISTEMSPARIVALAVCLGAVSVAESHIASPKLLGRHLNLNLLCTFLGLFLGERLWGGWGMFLAIPFLGIVRIVLASTPQGIPWSRLMSEEDRA